MNHHRYLHEQALCRELNNIVYWRLLYRTTLMCLAVFTIVGLLMQDFLEQTNYLKIMDITSLIVGPLLMAELIVRWDKYSNKSWNSMLLLASFIIVLSALHIFY
ncbi:MAG: hypothetical protein EOO69_01950 [Moraxellaceae bacterium]|nr:MAG: hypothetical protein EOO69_01950 [Moraxellaceae bacterium]